MNVPKKTIFIIDDDAMVRDIIRSALEREYNILEASGYSEAVRLSNNIFDIALIDYILPDGNGIDVLKAIRQVKPNLPVIIMTAYSSEEIVIKSLRAAATDYVKKPAVLSSLMKKVAHLLEGKQEDEYAKSAASREEFLLDSIAVYMEENYSDDLIRDDLAKRIGMNKYKFSKEFNDRYGQSIKSYLNNIRVKKAADLLKNHDINIGDIALSVGFGSIEHFNRVFREAYGISPKEYRNDPERISRQIAYLWESE